MCNYISLKTGVLLFFIAMIITVLIYLILPINELGNNNTGANNPGNYTPSYERNSGKELVMIFIGSPYCPYSTDSDLPEYVRSIKGDLDQIAYENDIENFVTIGVAISWETHEGIKLLNEFGEFNEINAGLNWGNTGAKKFIYKRDNRAANVPQILIIKREVEFAENLAPTFADERTLKRIIGRDDIISFAQGGANIFALY